MIEEKVSADLISTARLGGRGQSRQASEEEPSKYRKAVETAVEKSEKEKDQAKAQEVRGLAREAR